VPFETYYGGIVGNFIMFVVGYSLGSLIFRTKRDLTNLTVWTQSKEWKAMNEQALASAYALFIEGKTD
jgi:hypothetical protein